MRVLISRLKMLLFGAVAVAVVFGVAAARHSVPGPRSINPKGLYVPIARYAHDVIVPPGSEFVFVSGEGGENANGDTISDDVVAQTRQTMENLKTALAAAGSDFSHVVKMNIYLTDMDHMPELRRVRDAYLDPRHAPAMTTVKISSLVTPHAKVEIDVVAVRSH